MELYLEVGAHGLTAILATWLGLLVVTRARQAPGAPVFAFLSFLLVIWSVAIIGQRLGANAAMHPVLNVVEDFGAFLLPAATAHLGISVALEGRRSPWTTAVLGVGYGVGAAAWVQTAIDPDHPILPGPPHFEPLGIPGEVLGWGFILVRAGVFAAGIGWLIGALRRAGADVARQRQIQATLLTLGLGIIGGMARILPEGMGGPPWVGVSLIAFAAVVAVYAVLAQRLFVGASLTTRAFRLSVLVGLGIVVYVSALLAIDRALAEVIGLELPIVIALGVVLTIALFDPVANAARGILAGGDDEEAMLGRMLRALGEDGLSARHPHQVLEPAMARLVRTFDLTGTAILDREGRAAVVHGDQVSVDAYPTRLRLGTEQGHAAFGLKRSGLPLTPDEIGLLRLATSYVEAARQLGDRQDAQASALADLSRQTDAVERREAALVDALAAHSSEQPGLQVFAMGPLRAAIDGEAVRHWGGAKAGSRQAEAIFAFLFDRAERGAGKDEIIEAIWPDVDLERADMAFHRTLLGLRGVLAPGRARRGADGPISFANDRYRLQPDTVAWSDVGEFEEVLARARAVSDPDERLHLLEAARSLYRGEYLDDCPFYGDSFHVEERREDLRERYVDLLVDLGMEYAQRGDRSGAADALRRATAITSRDLPLAESTLAQLDAPMDVLRQPKPAEGIA
ncbi:MAG TPA: BTAD domain-containing putative transcriptional regulator [Candidatus Limnocylindria bacterium]|nr:BTAD domain-containing putative transcriptional regulator [Candidatus Limnocylindria bacterium]